MANNDFVADRRLYLDSEGNVVEADDPNRARLLVGVGGTVPAADAERYGLKAQSKAPENKQVDGPQATKEATKADIKEEFEDVGPIVEVDEADAEPKSTSKSKKG
jgi:hypothetical protein